MKIPTLAGLLPWIRQRFLLDVGKPPESTRATAMRRLHLQAARRHQEAARELSRPRHAASSLILYRASITEAFAARSGEDGGVSPLASAAALAVSLAAAGVDEPARSAAAGAFFELDAAALSELRWGEIHARMVVIDAIATRLIAGIELRSRATLRRTRALRIAAAMAAVLAALAIALAAWRAPKNLALHKPVTASSVLYGNPAGLVNGSIEWGSFAFHSSWGAPTWVLIDLEATSSIHEIRIWNRGDEKLADAAGTRVELSDDGATFRPAATCEDLFTQATPCRLALGDARARYVKLVHPVYLALSEVEVLGRR
jgi:hypothetical protein